MGPHGRSLIVNKISYVFHFFLDIHISKKKKEFSYHLPNVLLACLTFSNLLVINVFQIPSLKMNLLCCFGAFQYLKNVMIYPNI